MMEAWKRETEQFQQLSNPKNSRNAPIMIQKFYETP